MHCMVCSYSWCWTCGFKDDHWFHSVLFGGGALCELFNGFAFGFEFEVHWTIRFVLTILLICTAPALFILGAFVAYFGYLLEEIQNGDCFVLFCIEPPKNNLLFYLVWVPVLIA